MEALLSFITFYILASFANVQTCLIDRIHFEMLEIPFAMTSDVIESKIIESSFYRTPKIRVESSSSFWQFFTNEFEFFKPSFEYFSSFLVTS